MVCILHTEDLLLAACAVCAGLRLKNADLDNIVAGGIGALAFARIGRSRGRIARAAVARNERENEES